ncbi:MAG: cytochrome c [bacterium]
MDSRLSGVFWVICLVLLTTGCGLENTVRNRTSTDTSPENPVSNSTVSVKEGKQYYLRYCASCHGRDRSGRPPTYPSLKKIGEKRSRDFVKRRINNGKNIMPPFDYLAERKKKEIVKYLFSFTEQKGEGDTVTVNDTGTTDTSSVHKSQSQHRHRNRRRRRKNEGNADSISNSYVNNR